MPVSSSLYFISVLTWPLLRTLLPQNGPEEIATAYLRKLMAQFQEAQAKGDKPATKTFKAIHDYRKVWDCMSLYAVLCDRACAAARY